MSNISVKQRNQRYTAPPQVAKDFQRLLPHAELHWINECGHVPMPERPEKFNTLPDLFLTSVCRSVV